MKKEKLKRFLDQDNVVGYVFASPFILGFLLITVIPMILSLYYSFTDYRLGNPVSWIGLDNYIKMLSDARFLNSIRVTFLYVFASVPVKLIFGLLIAYLLTRNIKGTTFFRSLYYVPSLIGGSISIALVWRELFSKNGLVNIFLERLGAPALSWFSDQKLVMIPLVLMSAWQFGSAMIIFAAGIKEIPGSYYEAAEIDGANKWQTFYKITLPLLSPIILYNLVMQTIAAFMTFTQAFIITQGGPNDATNFYALYVYNQAFSFNSMGYASAISWIMLLIMGAVTFLIFKSSKINANASSGGLDIIGKVINKYTHIELGQSIAVVGALTVASSILVYDTKTLVIGFLGTYFNGIVIDSFISGFSRRKRVCILSQHHEQLADYIMHDLHRGVTLYEAKGGYDNSEKLEIVTILAKNEYAQLMEYIRNNDPKAFVTVSTVSEVVGYWNSNKKR